MAPILAYPRDEGLFKLNIDASRNNVGSKIGEEVFINYFSRSLNKPEHNYCATKKELLVVLKSVEHYHSFLSGVKFLNETDNSAT